MTIIYFVLIYLQDARDQKEQSFLVRKASPFPECKCKETGIALRKRN